MLIKFGRLVSIELVTWTAAGAHAALASYRPLTTIKEEVMDNTQRAVRQFVGMAITVFVWVALPVYGQPPLTETSAAESFFKRNHAGPKAFKERVQARRAATMAVNSGSPEVPPSTKGKCPPTCEELLDKARRYGTVNIIVGLNIPNLPEASRVPKERQAQVDQTRMEAVAQAQERLLKAMAKYKIKNVRKFKVTPGLAMSVDLMTLQALIADPDVKSIGEDYLASPSLSQSIPLIGADNAWSAGFTGAGYVIAILDTGVDTSHPFLADRIESEACYSTNATGTNPDDGNPWVATTLCPNGETVQIGAGAGVNCNSDISGCDHGTHVAGIAIGQGPTFSGVAKDARLVSVQVFSRVDGSICAPDPSPCAKSTVSAQIAALEHVYLSRGGLNLAGVNMSLGAQRYPDNCDDDPTYSPMKNHIDNLRTAGVATVVSSGNDGWSDATRAPACISSAISIGATTKGDVVANFSNSAPFLSLLAPGGDGSGGNGDIYSSVPGGGFDFKAGTSMAAPHVAGAFAVLKQQSPTASVNDIKSILESSGVPILDQRNNVTKRRIRLGGTPWMARYDGPARSEEEVAAITTDAAGNVYVTGTSCSDENCDASEFATVSYNSNGQQRWVQRYGNGFINVAAAIAVDGSSNVYVTGASCPDDVCFNVDFVTLKYDSSGNLEWTVRYVNPGLNNYGDNAPVAVSVNAGNVHIAGTACDTSEDCNIVIIKYAGDGTRLWAATYHNVEFDGASDMVVDASGNVHVAGSSCFTSPCQSNWWSSNINPIALKYDVNGNLLWVGRYVNEYSGNANSIAIDQAGSIYIAGWKSSGDPSALRNDLLVKYDPDGSQLWHISSGLEGRNNDVMVDGTGNILVTGMSGNFGYSTRKHTNTGALLWEATLAESDGAGGEAFALSVDNMNSPVVVGKVGNVFSEGGRYIGTVKYGANGNQAWKHFVGGRKPGGPVVAVDGGGNVVIAGTVLSGDNVSPTDYITLKYLP